MYRRLLLLALTLALAPALLQATASARSTAPPKCGKNVVFLVWPKGHPAIPRIAGFTKLPNPSIQLFRGFNSGYKVKSAGAFIVGGTPPEGTPRGGFYLACTNYSTRLTKGSVSKPSMTITKETAVKCTLPASPVVDLVYRAGDVVDLYVHANRVLLAQGRVTKSKATLTVVSAGCTLADPPRP